ncbi:uncharacterized protein LOC113513685 isoform X1 [Galleria mellonella]|uniref:Uncharacterized protein LOC113513685 isoform X1 n=1 Tax=Galleria mellonella TaxID=7137 RepID=A0ABM3MDJ2_GALME|nr:uncharacterized protein LOC113513685 isoform X1 [Galleria mellonella]
MHLFTITCIANTLLSKALCKMYLKYILTLCLVLVGVNSECDNYLKCLGDFINNFFGKINNTTNIENNAKNFTYYEVKDVNGSEFTKIITDISSLLKNESDGAVTSESVLSKSYSNNQTHLIIKLFEFNDKSMEFEADNGTTTEPEDTIDSVQEITINVNKSHVLTVTENVIKEVNNMIVNVENLEDNEVSFDESYFNFDDENNTDYPNIDYIELYKDATIEYNVLNVTVAPKVDDVFENEKEIDNIIDYSSNIPNEVSNISKDEVHPICHGNITQGVFPWIAAIFVKNTTIDNQFEYYCDGALLSERVILTAGRCVTTNSTVDPEDLIVILGKKSLHSTSENEQVHRVKSVNVHENYTVKDGVAVNDLAMLVLEESADLNKDVGAACMFGEQDIIIDYQKAATTAWSLSGDLTPIYFDKEKSRACNQKNKVENTFCSTYGDDVPLCPSYGGLHATKHTDEKWYLHGIRTGDPAAKRICIKRDITYTSVINFVDWILENVQSNKN